MSQPIRTTKDGPWLWISRQSVRAICELGHRASSTMSVYVALCEIASERKASVFMEPRHSIALRSGVCCRTVGYALTRLVGLGLIERDRGPEQVARFALTRRIDFLPSTRGTSLPHLEQAGAPPGALNAPPGALNALVDSPARINEEPAPTGNIETDRTPKKGGRYTVTVEEAANGQPPSSLESGHSQKPALSATQGISLEHEIDRLLPRIAVLQAKGQHERTKGEEAQLKAFKERVDQNLEAIDQVPIFKEGSPALANPAKPPKSLSELIHEDPKVGAILETELPKMRAAANKSDSPRSRGKGKS